MASNKTGKTGIRSQILDALPVDPSHDELIDNVETLWLSPDPEVKMAALELIGRHRELLRTDDAPLLERMSREAKRILAASA